MNPSAPVTRTRASASDWLISLSSARLPQMIAMPHVDPILLDLESVHGLATLEALVDETRQRELGALRHPRDDVRFEDVDSRVDEARERGLLLEVHDSRVLELDATERHGVVVAADADGHFMPAPL